MVRTVYALRKMVCPGKEQTDFLPQTRYFFYTDVENVEFIKYPGMCGQKYKKRKVVVPLFAAYCVQRTEDAMTRCNSLFLSFVF